MILIIATIIIGGILWYIHHKLTFWQRQGIVTPGLLYQWHYYRRELGPYDLELLHKLGPIYGTYDGLTPILIVSKPDLIKDVLVKEFANFPNHKPFKFGVPLMDNLLFALDGDDDWKRIRSLMTPAFTSGKLRGMEHIIHDALQNSIIHLNKISKDGTIINIRKYFNSLSFDIIARCAYGSQVDVLNEPDNPIFKNLENIFTGTWDAHFTIFFPKLSNLLGINKNAMKPFKFYENLAKELIDCRKDTKKPRQNDFLQLMIEANKEAEMLEENTTSSSSKKTISNIEMISQCFLFLMAGFDTTATIMACCAYYLSKNEDVQNKLIAEVSQIDKINYDTVMELKYLEAVIKESLRLSPPLMRVERQCIANTKIGNIIIQPGTIFSVSVYALQRDPKYYSNPEVFDPARFLDGGADVNHDPFAFIPFGAGPRICLAQRFALMEAKIAFAEIMKKYHFESTPETKLSYALASFDVLAPKEIMLRVKAH